MLDGEIVRTYYTQNDRVSLWRRVWDTPSSTPLMVKGETYLRTPREPQGWRVEDTGDVSKWRRSEGEDEWLDPRSSCNETLPVSIAKVVWVEKKMQNESNIIMVFKIIKQVMTPKYWKGFISSCKSHITSLFCEYILLLVLDVIRFVFISYNC